MLLTIAFGMIVYSWCGCIAIYARRQVTIRTIDIETSEPVPNAVIDERNQFAGAHNGPQPDHAISDQNGLARMRLARFLDGVIWKVSKGGNATQRGLGDPR